MALPALARSALNWAKNNKTNIVFNGGLGLYSGVDEYQEKREEGSSVIGAAASSIVDFALPMISMKLFLGYQAAKAIPGMAIDGAMAIEQQDRKLRRMNRQQAFTNASFSDTDQYHTMRQAGMAIAQRSRYNTEQAMIGNEAKYMMR